MSDTENPPPRTPPRYVPTLTEVVLPGAAAPEPARAPAPAPRPRAASRSDEVIADAVTRQLLRSGLDARLAEAVQALVDEELRAAQKRIEARLAATVRQALRPAGERGA